MAYNPDKPSTHGVGLDGKPKNVSFSDGQVRTPDRAFEVKDNVTGGLARAGAEKKFYPVNIHGGMYRMQNGQAIRADTASGKAPDGSSANPLDPTVPGKRLTPPAVSPGMKSRTSPFLTEGERQVLGQNVLDEAVKTR
jgi:hypothetical protein